MFEFDFIVGSNDVDCFYDLKVSSIYQLFQEAAMKDVERFGSGSNVLKEKNLDWIITNMTVEIYRLPVLLEKIKVITQKQSRIFLILFFDIFINFLLNIFFK